jgi:hypothetical protein
MVLKYVHLCLKDWGLMSNGQNVLIITWQLATNLQLDGAL